MKKNILTLLSVFWFHFSYAQECELQTSGAYICTTEKTTQGFNEFIRFYDNGEVISAISVYSLQQSISWFHINDETVAQGSYKLNDCNISFATRSGDNKFYYEGVIEGDFLKLQVLYPGKRKKELVTLEFEYIKIDLK